MIIKELGQIDFSDDQMNGLAQEVVIFNQRKSDAGEQPISDVDYLIGQISDLMTNYAEKHITSIKRAKVIDAFNSASEITKDQIAAILGVSLAGVDNESGIIK